MKFLWAWDDAQVTDRAFNLYACEQCGMVLKEDVWENGGKRWLDLEGKLSVEGIKPKSMEETNEQS